MCAKVRHKSKPQTPAMAPFGTKKASLYNFSSCPKINYNDSIVGRKSKPQTSTMAPFGTKKAYFTTQLFQQPLRNTMPSHNHISVRKFPIGHGPAFVTQSLTKPNPIGGFTTPPACQNG